LVKDFFEENRIQERKQEIKEYARVLECKCPLSDLPNVHFIYFPIFSSFKVSENKSLKLLLLSLSFFKF